MALARFKDLVIDASDARRQAAFWAAVLGLRLEETGTADAVLRGRTPAHTVWIDQVPEPTAVKNRVHLDVYTADVGALVGAGATVLNDRDFRWVVMVDPDGQEFCAFVRADPPEDRLYELVVDCAEPAAVAAWWGDVLGVAVTGHDDPRWFTLERIPGAPFEGLSFVTVPEPKTVKNRVHWDVYGSTDALVAAGATLLRARTEDPEPDRTWDVLADPAGNEFCVFAS